MSLILMRIYLYLITLFYFFSAICSEEKLQKAIHFNPNGPNTIGHLYIGDHQDSISESTWLYMKQGLEYYKKNPPIFIILELNTPGGEVFAAQKISDALREIDMQNDIPVVAFINNWAISAGAMLAYSSRFITTMSDGSMGAAEPVSMGTEGKMETSSEKVISAIRSDFGNRASFFDRNPLIAEAMVDKDLILVRRDGKIIKVDTESQILPSDVVISPKGKLLTLNAEQMMRDGVADMLFKPQKLTPLTNQEKKTGKWPLSKTVFKQAEFFKNIPEATVDSYQMDWKTRFFVFLATPFISSLLLMGLVIGAYIEFNHPGVSLPGVIAVTCLFLMILSSLSLQIANWLEVILLVTGLLMILVEIFILPTVGILAVIGAILFFVGLFGMLLPEFKSVDFEYDTNTWNAAGQYFLKRLAWLSGSLILSIGIIALLARYVLPSFKGFNRFVLAGHEQDASKGYYAGEDPNTLPQPGTTGEVLAPLRPAGKVMINDQIYEAISTGDFIQSGEPIVVVGFDAGTLVVRHKEQR